MRWPLWRVAVAERSMEPALMRGDWLLAWRGIASRSRDASGTSTDPRQRVRVRPGQLVVARHPNRPGMLLVKRAAWRESGGWWLTADNPGVGGVDSFRFGPVPADLIEARVLVRYWPPRRGQTN